MKANPNIDEAKVRALKYLHEFDRLGTHRSHSILRVLTVRTDMSSVQPGAGQRKAPTIETLLPSTLFTISACLCSPSTLKMIR
jgi:hypothetical protein